MRYRDNCDMPARPVLVLADDQAMMRDGLRPFIQAAIPGVVLHEAGSHDEMIAHLQAGQPVDLLVVDPAMRGMGGFPGLTTLRRQFPALACAVLSTQCDRQRIVEAMRLGLRGYIPKQMSAAALASALRLVLVGEKFLPAGLIEAALAEAAPAPAAPSSLDARLTPREAAVLALIREGLTNKLIARRLGLSEVTVKSHLYNLFRKLKVRSRLEAARHGGQ